jgi:hypothetical protein
LVNALRLPNGFFNDFVDAGDQNVFVVRAIEDGDLSPFASAHVRRKEWRLRSVADGYLKAMTFRFLSAHGARNRPVLAGCVHTLQRDHQAAGGDLSLRAEHVDRGARLRGQNNKPRLKLCSSRSGTF